MWYLLNSSKAHPLLDANQTLYLLLFRLNVQTVQCKEDNLTLHRWEGLAVSAKLKDYLENSHLVTKYTSILSICIVFLNLAEG